MLLKENIHSLSYTFNYLIFRFQKIDFNVHSADYTPVNK